jgi:23S rRNA (uracil1939-C5)-methyltransferase
MMADVARIERLAGRGDGVTADGRYAPLAAPGDLFRFGAQGPELVESGACRVVPPCRHFPACGGCQLQHVADPAYARWCEERIAWALRGVGLAAAHYMPAHLSPPRSRRRATLRAVRTAAGAVLGFSSEGSHRLIDMAECLVLRPELFALVAPLRSLLARRLRPGHGAGVSLTLSDTGIDLLLSNLEVGGAGDAAELAGFAAAGDLARLSIEGPGGIEVIATRRPPVVTLGGVEVRLPPVPFLQATQDGEAALVAAVLDAVAGARRVADLFCGLGTFALPLAARGAAVMAVDASGPAAAALGEAARVARPGVTVAHRDLFRRPLTATELAGFDAVVFDPPRAGAKEQAAELARSGVPRVVAVSCNPATFARDAALLAGGGYRPGRVWPVGQFRWSTHIELVAEFERSANELPATHTGRQAKPVAGRTA